MTALITGSQYVITIHVKAAGSKPPKLDVHHMKRFRERDGRQWRLNT